MAAHCAISMHAASAYVDRVNCVVFVAQPNFYKKIMRQLAPLLPDNRQTQTDTDRHRQTEIDCCIDKQTVADRKK